jgi:glycosyltransferase involved in cell wall biosynthesis
MLSILIPIFNFDLRPLVRALLAQTKGIQTPVEIILLDDASSDGFRQKNREMEAWNGVSYEELPQNVGRAKIRNLLAKKANYAYLLFMDGDSKVVKADYLQQYVQDLKPDTLLYGGRVYASQPPKEAQFHLHWFVGKAREESTAAERSKQPYHSFMTNNYVVPKAIQLDFPFEEQLRQYGHEDTLFGLQLQKAGIKIVHLDNPLEHIGLESADQFLDKSRKAIQNLLFLAKIYPEMQTKLLHTANRLKKWRLDAVVRQLFRQKAKKWENRFQQKNPDLTTFDLWKLGVLLEEMQKTTTQ